MVLKLLVSELPAFVSVTHLPLGLDVGSLYFYFAKLPEVVPQALVCFAVFFSVRLVGVGGVFGRLLVNRVLLHHVHGHLRAEARLERAVVDVHGVAGHRRVVVMLDSMKPLGCVLGRDSLVVVESAVADRHEVEPLVRLELLDLGLEVLGAVVEHGVALELVVAVAMAFDLGEHLVYCKYHYNNHD